MATAAVSDTRVAQQDSASAAGGRTALTYRTLDGRVLDVRGLTASERAYLARCYAAYRAGMPWEQFTHLSVHDHPLLRATGGRVTRAVWEHPLFQAVQDLEDRLGIQQGELAPEPGPSLQHDPFDDEWLPTGEAARRKEVTLPGLRKAVQRGDVIARPAPGAGTRLLVSANSLDRWRPNPVRQAARRGRMAPRAG